MKLIYNINSENTILSKSFNDEKINKIDLSNFDIDTVYSFIKCFDENLNYIEDKKLDYFKYTNLDYDSLLEFNKINRFNMIKKGYDILNILSIDDTKLVNLYINMIKNFGYCFENLESSCINIIMNDKIKYENSLNILSNLKFDKDKFNFKWLIKLFDFDNSIKILTETFRNSLIKKCVKSMSDLEYFITNNLYKYKLIKINKYILFKKIKPTILIIENFPICIDDERDYDHNFDCYLSKIPFVFYNNKFYNVKNIIRDVKNKYSGKKINEVIFRYEDFNIKYTRKTNILLINGIEIKCWYDDDFSINNIPDKIEIIYQ